MVRTFAAGQCIGVVFIKLEILCTVIQRNTSAGNDNAGSEPAEIGLNEADHIAFTVCTAEVNGGRASWFTRFRHDGLIVNQSAAFGSVFFAEELIDGNFHVGRLCNVLSRIHHGEFHGLDLLVHCVDAIPFTKLHIFENLQSHQHSNTVPVRRQLPNIHTVVVHANRIYPFGFKCS